MHNIVNLARRRPFNEVLMQMNCYDLDRLIRLLQDFGCPDVHLRFTQHRDYSGVILFFRRTQQP